MPYQVQQIIEDKGMPVCVSTSDSVSAALSLMIEHDYSQLPVVQKNGEFESPVGLVTYEGILRGIKNFNARIDELNVRDVMGRADVFGLEDDLFDILDRLKETNAVLVVEAGTQELAGIITSYDATEYFRNRTEDMMRVEDIELIIRDFILAAHTSENDELDKEKLSKSVIEATAYKKTSKELAFSDLSLGDYINLLLRKKTWDFVAPIFGVKRDFVKELLNGIREIRNELAHFRGDITAEQRDKLKFGSDWLSKRQEEYQEEQEKLERTKIFEEIKKRTVERSSETASTEISAGSADTEFSVAEVSTGGGRYAALADWLQSQPGNINKIELTFDDIEKIIGAPLPPSARNHRAWWANDSVGHSQSQQWLEAGWRRTFLNMSEERVTFVRIQEREKAYISFFSKLIEEFQNYPSFPLRDVSPDGASWMIVQTLPKVSGAFSVSFTRGKKVRVEFYLDTGEQETTKEIFDKFYAHKEDLEQKLGSLEWERLNNRRASRIALYRAGYIPENENDEELIRWAASTTDKFYAVFSALANAVVDETVA